MEQAKMVDIESSLNELLQEQEQLLHEHLIECIPEGFADKADEYNNDLVIILEDFGLTELLKNLSILKDDNREKWIISLFMLCSTLFSSAEEHEPIELGTFRFLMSMKMTQDLGIEEVVGASLDDEEKFKTYQYFTSKEFLDYVHEHQLSLREPLDYNSIIEQVRQEGIFKVNL